MGMTKARKRLAGWAGLVGLAAGITAFPALANPPPSAATVDCVVVRGEASFASVGYDHLVHLTNNCKKRAACSVKTDVNPDVAQVELAPGESQTLVTWRGSPAREFKPDVSCRER